MYAVMALITLAVLMWAIAIWATFEAEDEAVQVEMRDNQDQTEQEEVKKVA